MADKSRSSKLFQPVQLGNNMLRHRIAMAPRTRFRAQDDHTPTVSLAEEYYAQRACVPGTLIISEGSFVSPKAGGYLNIPGIFNAEQVEAWRQIVQRVHDAGSVIFLQIAGLGRTADPHVRQIEGTGPMTSPSDLPMDGDSPKPQALTDEEIEAFIQEFADAAKRAVEGAGFDGIEIHGANGYLIDQFTQDVSNHRTDKWGGSIENRSRFAVEIVKAVANAVGPERTAIRLSPFNVFQGMKMEDPIPQFSHLLSELKTIKPVYLHLIEARVRGSEDHHSTESLVPFIELWDNTSAIVLAGGYLPESARRTVAELEGFDILIAFGRYFISTPDLVYRVYKGIELNPYDRATFYTLKSSKGYVDYGFSEELLKEGCEELQYPKAG
ncbi:hypothetical protein M409DRAFT_69278 [Zasmidium cellare ATCC 36951]|uniref:NADH:flavin oxidoreductase/NADH oxidase N-terminal domain-containing protein n=1 Tax=Zasmidium cellare ATCC 36951 TaxID=1080233 RepID=A0A6A6C9B9_ZASCE|nr:uncharacterized protein M409DRAFT_69278 [Zasmidium cellare ATCC 36951]KAF2162036.1 hypothetical protein M409DRAFT_69278 [Zasmidium cellare ATCC 36951]